jgi:hypothetical protein
MADSASNGHIAVDLSKSRLSDWTLVASAQGGKMDMAAMPAWIEFLDRVLVGGADAYSMDKLPDVIKAVSEKLGEMANPKAPPG